MQLEHAAGRYNEVQRSRQKLDHDTGGQQTIMQALSLVGQDLASAHDRLRQANGRAAVVREALHYLEQAAGEPVERCPVCEQPATDLLERLREDWEKRLQSRVAGIETEINTLRARQQELQASATIYERLVEKAATALQELADCRKRIGELTGKRLSADDDLAVILKTELAALEARGREIGKVIEEKEKSLGAVEEELAHVRLIREILSREEKRQILERIQESPSYEEATRLRDELADWAADLQSIEEALLAAAKVEAQEKLQSAEVTIDPYFSRLARHPAIRRICLKVSERNHRNDYEITDEDGHDLTPILSQGDLNALALAIFLGLATTSADAGTFGFILLDDPSQSLGAEHKKQLVQALDEVARKKKVVVATMDAELRELLLVGMTTGKSEYTYGSWTPASGPLVTNGEMK